MEKKKIEYSHHRQGDIIKVEIRDFTRRMLYRKKFNVRDKQALLELLEVMEKFSGFSIYNLISEKLKFGEWW